MNPTATDSILTLSCRMTVGGKPKSLDTADAANLAQRLDGLQHRVAEAAGVGRVPAHRDMAVDVGVLELDGQLLEAVALREDLRELFDQRHVAEPRRGEDVALHDVDARCR